MSGYQKLVGHIVEHRPEGLAVGEIRANLNIDGVFWEIPCPMVEVAHNVVITPQASAVTGNIVFHLDRWEVRRLNPKVVLPVVAINVGAAVKIYNAFRADRAISFDDSPEKLTAWVDAYLTQQPTAVNQ